MDSLTIGYIGAIVALVGFIIGFLYAVRSIQYHREGEFRHSRRNEWQGTLDEAHIKLREESKDAARRMAEEASKELGKGRFKISLSHPKLLSKRFTSSFVVHIYLPIARREVINKLKAEFEKQEAVEHIYDSVMTVDRVVKVNLYSPEIVFSDPQAKILNVEINTLSFLGKPRDDSHPGVHQASLVISDEKTGNVYHSVNFPVHIVDFAFDHVPRPVLSSVVSLALGTGSLVMFMLTLVGRIDTAFGLTSGATTGALASAIYLRFLTLYQRLKVNDLQ